MAGVSFELLQLFYTNLVPLLPSRARHESCAFGFLKRKFKTLEGSSK